MCLGLLMSNNLGVQIEMVSQYKSANRRYRDDLQVASDRTLESLCGVVRTEKTVR